MALDGTVMASLTAEIGNRLEGGKIAKIAQPEKDEKSKKHMAPAHFGKRQSSASLLYGAEQAEPYDSAQFLYALKKAYWKRPYHEGQPAGAGAYHLHGD